jgi:hypothetical protein
MAGHPTWSTAKRAKCALIPARGKLVSVLAKENALADTAFNDFPRRPLSFRLRKFAGALAVSQKLPYIFATTARTSAPANASRISPMCEVAADEPPPFDATLGVTDLAVATIPG